MAGELFTLWAKLGIKDDEFNKGVKDASNKGKSLAGGLQKAFKVSAAAIGITAGAVIGVSKAMYSGIKQTADYGDKVDKMSQKIGISAEEYQKWDYVMQRAGGNVDSLKMGMKTLSQQAEKNSDAFQKLGISQEEVANSSKEELFNKTVSALAGMEDGTERTALAAQLLGRAGADMAPLLNQGTKAIEEQKKIAEDYGMVMSNKTVKASAEFKDSLTTLGMTFKGLKNRMLGEFLPAVTEITDGLALLFTSTGQEEGLEKITQGITATIEKFSEFIPKIAEIAVPIIETLGTAIIENLPLLVTTAFNMVMQLGTYIIQNLPLIISTGLNILLTLAQGITQALPTLLPAITSVILEIATMLTEPDMLVQLIDAALQLIIALADGLIAAQGKLLEKAPEIVMNLVQSLAKAAPKLIKSGWLLITKLVAGIKDRIRLVGTWGSNIFNRIKETLGEKISAAWNWGADLVSNFLNGLKSGWDAVITWIKNLAQKIKDIIGFSEPKIGPLSQFHTFAPDMIDLWNKGIKDNEWKVAHTVEGLADTIGGGFTGYDYDDGYASTSDTLRLELSVADNGGGDIGLKLARMLLPYIRIAEDERG